MQGKWKETVGGWNHKDTFRKKTKRKHNFKDKYKGFYKRGIGEINNENYKPDKLKYEPIIEKTKLVDKNTNHSLDMNSTIFKALISYRTDFRPHKEGYKIRKEIELNIYFHNYGSIYVKGYDISIYDYLKLKEFYFNKNGCDTYVTNYDLKRIFDLNINWMKEVDRVEWEYVGFEIELKTWLDCSYKKEFFYDKQINSVVAWKMYRESKYSSKWIQKMENKKIRCRTRDFIKKGKYDLIQTHPYYGYW